VIERRAVLLDLAHHTPGLGYKRRRRCGSVQHTMPLYYLFGLDEIEPRSFGDALILVVLRWLLTALLAMLIGLSLCLLELILLERLSTTRVLPWRVKAKTTRTVQLGSNHAGSSAVSVRRSKSVLRRAK
jgi:hypothetical protein